MSPATSTVEDTALVIAARDGDTGAFGHLYTRYARMVHGILLARLPHDAVEDVVQEVFLAALGQLRGLREPGAFGRIAAIPAIYFVATFARPIFAGSERVPSDLVLPESTKDHPWKISLVEAGEPGHPMIVSGHVFEADGRTPHSGLRLFAYQTDNRGYYAPDGKFMPPRLHGTMWTNVEGRYEFHSIKPGPYPGRAIPAHVHIFLFLPNGQRVEPEELQFEGDPFLKLEDVARNSGKETFSSIRPLVPGKDGILHCVRDFKLPGN